MFLSTFVLYRTIKVKLKQNGQHIYEQNLSDIIRFKEISFFEKKIFISMGEDTH